MLTIQFAVSTQDVELEYADFSQQRNTQKGKKEKDKKEKEDDDKDPPSLKTQTNVRNIGLDRLDQESLPLDGSYSYTYTGRDVTAFILDSGIRWTHAEFEGRARCGYDATLGNESDVPCEDRRGHATHVAGSIGGRNAGVAKDVDLVAVKVGLKRSVAASAVIAGLEWVAQQKRDHPDRSMVAVMSIGGNPFPAIDEAARAVVQAGVPLILSAGNNYMNACERSPQRVEEAITVGVALRDDTVPDWSNFGNCIDVYAPGDAIASAWKKNDTDIREATGSSFGAPFVAGAAALKLQEHPEYNPGKVWNALKKDALKKVLTGVNGDASTNRLVHIPN